MVLESDNTHSSIERTIYIGIRVRQQKQFQFLPSWGFPDSFSSYTSTVAGKVVFALAGICGTVFIHARPPWSRLRDQAKEMGGISPQKEIPCSLNLHFVVLYSNLCCYFQKSTGWNCEIKVKAMKRIMITSSFIVYDLVLITFPQWQGEETSTFQLKLGCAGLEFSFLSCVFAQYRLRIVFICCVFWSQKPLSIIELTQASYSTNITVLLSVL